MSAERQPKLRIDKWLWYARVVKTRSLATKLVQAGHVRVNKTKINTASHTVSADDVLTISVHNRIKVLKVVALGERRGPASEAALLYEDLSPPPPKRDDAKMNTKTPAPEKRPGKRDRRKIEIFKSTLR